MPVGHRCEGRILRRFRDAEDDAWKDAIAAGISEPDTEDPEAAIKDREDALTPIFPDRQMHAAGIEPLL